MIFVDNLAPRLADLLDYPKNQITGIAMGIMRIFGYDNVPKDFFEFDLYSENPTIGLNSKYIDKNMMIVFPEEET